MAVHVVRPGEDLWAIAQLYNTPASTIATVNGLASSALQPGLALYIPQGSLTIRSHIFKAGDTLWNLASQFSTAVGAITAANPGVDAANLRVGQVLAIPSPAKLAIRTTGFFVPGGGDAGQAVIDPIANQLTYLAIVNYSFTEQGYAYAESDDAAIIARSRSFNIIPLLMVRNFTDKGFSAELAGTVFGNPTYRTNLVKSLANLALTRGFGGVSLDIEFIPPANRNDFNVFLRELKQQLAGLELHVNVHAKTADLPTNRIVGAYDYKTISEIADIMAIMTIDYGYPGGPPDPVAPIWWVAEVTRYALSLADPRKLFIAIALYGYDKTVATKDAKGLSVLAAQNKAIQVGSAIQFDSPAKSPWYRYWSGAEEHVVWFEDIRSFIEKYQLIDRYRLAGTTYWQVGLQAPQNWAYVANEVAVAKVKM